MSMSILYKHLKQEKKNAMKNLILIICVLIPFNANSKNSLREAQDSIEKMNSMNVFMKMDKSTKEILRKAEREMNGKSIMRKI